MLDNIDWAMERHRARDAGQSLAAWLEDRIQLPREEVLRLLAQQAGLRFLSMRELDRLMPQFERYPLSEAVRRQCFAARDAGGAMLLVVSDHWDLTPSAHAAFLLGEPFETVLADADDLAAWLVRHEAQIQALPSLSLGERAGGRTVGSLEALSLSSIADDTSLVVRTVRSTLYDALKAGASDIHLETTPRGLTVRYRIDGVLSQVAQLEDPELAEQAISRIKVMAELDIAEHRIPQDGRLKVGRCPVRC